MHEFLRRRLSREEAVGLSFTLSFLAVGMLAVALGWMAQEIREDHGRAGPLDLRVSQALISERSPELTEAMLAVTLAGDQRFLVFATPAVIAALWFGRRRVSALLFAGSVVGGFGLGALLKIALARARPDQWTAIVTESTYSFPSGHTVMATVFFGGLAAIVFHRTRRLLPRVLAVTGAAAIVLAVAVSRVYLGAHWPTDTLAGILTGLVWVVVFSATTESLTKVQARRQKVREGQEAKHA